jgi:hypothetical protein
MQCEEVCLHTWDWRDAVCRITHIICGCEGCSVHYCVYHMRMGGMQCVEIFTLYAGARDGV